MNNLNPRTVMTYGLIGFVGLILLMLVLPSVFGGSLNTLVLMFTLVPLVLLLGLLVFLFGKPKTGGKDEARNATIAKALAQTVVAGSLLSILVTLVSEQVRVDEHASLFFFLQNTGVALNFIAAAAGLVLVNQQNYVYWPLWSKSDKKMADERQRYVRQRAFEKAYGLNIVLGLVIWFCYSGASNRLQNVLICVLLTSILFLPAVLAVRQKAS